MKPTRPANVDKALWRVLSTTQKRFVVYHEEMNEMIQLGFTYEFANLRALSKAMPNKGSKKRHKMWNMSIDMSVELMIDDTKPWPTPRSWVEICEDLNPGTTPTPTNKRDTK